jgi:hypothetical protein
MHVRNKCVKFNLSQHIDRLKFYKLPKDLVELNRQAGFCEACKHISSKLKICFFCGIKICIKCKNILV